MRQQEALNLPDGSVVYREVLGGFGYSHLYTPIVSVKRGNILIPSLDRPGWRIQDVDDSEYEEMI